MFTFHFSKKKSDKVYQTQSILHRWISYISSYQEYFQQIFLYKHSCHLCNYKTTKKEDLYTHLYSQHRDLMEEYLL